MPKLDDELTDELEPWRVPDVELDDVEALAVVLAVELVLDVEDPGMVAALTTPSAPTPATAARATPAVKRLRSRIAELRAWILEAA